MPSLQRALQKLTFSSAELKNQEKALMSSVFMSCLGGEGQEASPPPQSLLSPVLGAGLLT